MKSLKKDLAAMLETLRLLTKKAEKMKKKLRTFEKSAVLRVAERSSSLPGSEEQTMDRNATEKPFRTTAITSIFGIIRRSRKGVTTEQIMKKTGFDEKKIWNVINRLKSQGLVRNAEKGLYVKS